MENIQKHKYSFVLPFYNHWDLTHARLGEFRKFLPDSCEIVLVDDCSTEEDCRKGIAFWQKSGAARHPIKYTRNETNKGFPYSVNKGVSIASGDVVVIYSNDVVMFRDITKELDPIFEERTDDVLIGNRIIDWDGGWNSIQHKGHTSIIPYLEGWFLACRKSVWEKLGGFDERYGLSDFEDVDLSTAAMYYFIPTISLNSTALKHLGGQSFKFDETRLERTKKNKLLWEEKWQDKWDEFFK